MSLLLLATSPRIRCAMRSCDWKGLESDRIAHPADVGKSSQRLVCPECQHEKFSVIGRKGPSTCAYLEVMAVNEVEKALQ